LKSGAGAENFRDFWTVRGHLQEVGAGLTAATVFGLFVGICVAQTNSLFSADAWNNITFTAGEVVNPRRNVPLSLALGTFLVIGLYLLANIAYLATLPFNAIQNAPSDRVASRSEEHTSELQSRRDLVCRLLLEKKKKIKKKQ